MSLSATVAPLLLCAAAVCADLDTAEAGDACRQAELANDEKSGFKGNYKSLTSGPESTYMDTAGLEMVVNDDTACSQ